MWQTGFFVILDHFLPYYPPNNPENQNFDKMKKIVGDDIILHMCTKNPNHTKYGSWDTESDRQFFLSFWAIFVPFYPTNNLENQNFEKMKKTPGTIIILHMCTKHHDMLYCSWDIACDRCNF